jgi:hypothetical protein
LPGRREAVPALEADILALLLVDAVRSAPGHLRHETAQDALDTLATAAGLKPMTIAGVGYDAPDFLARLDDAARGAGLATRIGPLWASAAEPEVVWYREALQVAANAAPVFFVARERAPINETIGRRLDAAEQAAALGYPLCCAREHHRQQRLLHLISLRMIARQAGNDEAQMRRLAEAQVVLTPRSATEARRLAVATSTTFAPFTSIAMCSTCAADPASPARQISARFGELAADTGFHSLLQ